MYASSSSNNGNGMPQHHYGSSGGPSSGGHHHLHHQHQHHPAPRSSGHQMDNNGGGGAPNGYFVDAYLGDRDDTRTPPAPMWAAAPMSPPSARGGGMRGSPPLRGMPGGCAGGPGGLGYKDRSRQASLDEGRLLGGGGGGCGGGGARTMRCSSDSASQMMMASSHGGSGGGGAPECNGNGGHEFSLDLKKVGVGFVSGGCMFWSGPVERSLYGIDYCF